MRLSDGERLIAAMLAEVMKTVGANSEFDPDLLKTLLWSKDDWAIRLQYEHLFGESSASDDDVKETVDILWMWGIVEHGISSLTGNEKKEAGTWHWTKFDGFDANNDDHYHIARTLIKNLGNFDEFEDRNLNSHSRLSLPNYRSMYEKFEGMLSANKGGPLSFDQLKELCN